MDRKTAQDLLPRFLNAVTGMAVSRGPVHARVAEVVSQIEVFGAQDFPDDLRARYMELDSLLSEPVVPTTAREHPDFRKQVPAYYLSPRKARRAADLIIEILEAIVYGLDQDG